MTEHFDAGTLAMAREGLLDDTEAAQVRAHLAACASCRREDTQLALVTQILATAPAPPMPPELSARIEAALAAEAAARPAGAAAGGIAAADAGQPATAQPGTARPGPEQPGAEPAGSRAGAVPAGTAAGAPVPGRAARRGGHGAGPRPGDGRPPRRRPRRLTRSQAMLRTMAAAAVIVVAGGGGYALSQVLGRGSAGPESSGASSAAGLPGAPSPVRHGAAGIQPSASAPTTKITVFPVTSGTSYTRQKFASQISATLVKYPIGSMGHRASSAAHALPGGALSGCVQAVTGGQQPRLVDLATYQGRPATIIVVTANSQGPGHVWVVGRACSATSPDIRAQYPVP